MASGIWLRSLSELSTAKSVGSATKNDTDRSQCRFFPNIFCLTVRQALAARRRNNSDNSNVGGVGALRALRHFVLDLVVLIEALVTEIGRAHV